jgi:hypothetical protein
MTDAAWVAIIITIILNIAGWCFSAGILYQRLKSLETTVIQGLNDRLNKQDARLDHGDTIMRQHGEEITGINERCKAFHRDAMARNAR